MSSRGRGKGRSLGRGRGGEVCGSISMAGWDGDVDTCLGTRCVGSHRGVCFKRARNGKCDGVAAQGNSGPSVHGGRLSPTLGVGLYVLTGARGTMGPEYLRFAIAGRRFSRCAFG